MCCKTNSDKSFFFFYTDINTLSLTQHVLDQIVCGGCCLIYGGMIIIYYKVNTYTVKADKHIHIHTWIYSLYFIATDLIYLCDACGMNWSTTDSWLIKID